jgi:O-6-methylguanine DNA methyltransferase
MAQIATPAGTFTACFSGRGLVSLNFPTPSFGPHAEAATTDNSLARSAPGRAPGPADDPSVQEWVRQTTEALGAVLRGERPGTLPPLDWSRATAFQRKVWSALLQIEPGRTLSYGEIARVAGCPKAVRAVGGACGANPIPVLVPCHRVLAAGQRIGGFSAGLDWKRILLGREGVRWSETES